MKIILSRKKKIIILSALILILVFIIAFILIKNKNNAKLANNSSSTALKIIYLSEREKSKLNIKPELKIQVLKRNNQGTATAWKIINNDSDVISDFNQVKVINPSSK